MRITITARHTAVPDELRRRARALLERLTKLASRSPDAQVIFVEDHGRPAVEVRLHAGRGTLHVGTADAADLRTALDRAAAKVRRQLDKAPGRRRAAHPRRAREREPR
ncbi:MAG TPA: HPF/RaiA family ribosome-associated protein [Gemmatimonadales bacterium]|jgi:ribosomal subunit interface protein|nr:HPF/RaiA family ribosome-associated protein [Gemmatimonadales bacterium]